MPACLYLQVKTFKVVKALLSFSAGDESLTLTLAPLETRNLAVETPVRARPTTKTFYSLIPLKFSHLVNQNSPNPLFIKEGVRAGSWSSYLSFNVLIATRARIIDIIQNLTITLGSAHPLSSK